MLNLIKDVQALENNAPNKVYLSHNAKAKNGHGKYTALESRWFNNDVEYVKASVPGINKLDCIFYWCFALGIIAIVAIAIFLLEGGYYGK